MNRAQRILGRAVLLLVSTAIGLKIADVVVGKLDPNGISHFSNHNKFTSTCIDRRPLGESRTMMDFPIPNSRAECNVVYQINSLGFRGREYAVAKPADTWRLVVIGDSVTFGWGVSVEDRFTDVLEKRLNDRAEKGRHYEVLNLGVPGYETVHHFVVFREALLKYQPDAIVVVFNRNDVQNDTSESLNMQALSRERVDQVGFFARMFVDEPWRSALDATLPNLRLLGVYQYVYQLRENDGTYVTNLYANMQQGVDISLKLLKMMYDKATAQQVGFAVFDLHDVVPIRDGLAKLGVPYRSISYGNDITDMSLRNSAVDPHPNAKGHAIAADRMEAGLRELSLLK